MTTSSSTGSGALHLPAQVGNSFRAWHLPAHDVREVRPLAETAAGAIYAPALAPEDLAEAAVAARQAGRALRACSNDQVIAAIDAVAGRFLDPADPLRREALRWLPETTGYHPLMCELVLDRMAADWRAPALRALLRAEFRDPRVLTEFVQHAPGQRVRAIPPGLILHVLAGNVPGVGVTSLVRSLLVRAPAICKLASGEPILPVLFARALAQAAPELGAALAVTYWTGGDQAIEQAVLEHCDLVVHYGGAAALADLRRRLSLHVRTVEHGPRISFGAVAREHARRSSSVRDAARAVATFDQQGCVSPHLIYVEGEPPSARNYAARLAERLQRLAQVLPRGRLTTVEAASIQQVRSEAEFRALAAEGVEVFAGAALSHTVIFDPDPAFAASCLNRTVWVRPIPALEHLPELVRPHAGLLQTVALDAPRKRLLQLASELAMAGVTRLSSLAAMPWPPPSWHHDGQGPLRELVRFSDLEFRRK